MSATLPHASHRPGNKTPSLELRGVAVERGGRWLLDGIDLTVQPGCLHAIIGPNGSGKTTLLRVFAGLWRPDRGQVLLDGQALAERPRRELARQLGYVPQSSRPQFRFRVEEIVAMGRFAHEPRLAWRRGRHPAVEQALAATDTVELRERIVTELSGGELQRVLVARALATQARILLLDEPTASLDPAHVLEVLQLLRKLTEQGRAVVVALHDLGAVESHADRVTLLDAGRVVADGPREQILLPERIAELFGVRARPRRSGEGFVLEAL